MSSLAFRALAATFSLFAFVACGQVQSLSPDAASDGTRPPPTTRADSAPDVTVHDAGYAPSPPAYDAGHDAASDSTPHDAGADTTLPDSSPDAAVPHDAAADVALDSPVDAFHPFDAGHDATFPPDGYFAGPPDAEWLVDAAVDASSCATIAQSLCARIAACPNTDTSAPLCFRIDPETICFGDYAGCVAYFSACVPTTSPPPSRLTFMPDPAACAAAIVPDLCMKQGADYDYEVPTSCGVCPMPWVGSPACQFNLPDAGPDAF